MNDVVFKTFNDTDHSKTAWDSFNEAYNNIGLGDDEIEVYVEDDDMPYTFAGMHPGAAVFVVILISAIIGACIFYCSYNHERTGSCCPKPSSLMEKDEDEETDPLRSCQDIERGLKLKQWETIRETFDDEERSEEMTHTSGSSDNEVEKEEGGTAVAEKEEGEAVEELEEQGDNEAGDQDETGSLVSVAESINDAESATGSVTESNTGSDADCSHCSVFMQDKKFVELQRKPRCVLCSKFFQDSDIVTESWERSCRHHFHKECIIKWLQTHKGFNACPVCKKDYVVGFAIEEIP